MVNQSITPSGMLPSCITMPSSGRTNSIRCDHSWMRSGSINPRHLLYGVVGDSTLKIRHQSRTVMPWRFACYHYRCRAAEFHFGKSFGGENAERRITGCRSWKIASKRAWIGNVLASLEEMKTPDKCHQHALCRFKVMNHRSSFVSLNVQIKS